jgi:hypothetical protein
VTLVQVLLSFKPSHPSIEWERRHVLQLIENASQETLCTNSEENSCPYPFKEEEAVTSRPPCRNTYITPHSGARFPYAYCIRVLVQALNCLDMLHLDDLETKKDGKTWSHIMTPKSHHASLQDELKAKKLRMSTVASTPAPTSVWTSDYARGYFQHRYHYYLDFLLDSAPDIFILPTMQSVGVTTLLNLRSSAVQLCGVTFSSVFVDEDLQSPCNFFWHDINHARRIYQNDMWYAQKTRSTLQKLRSRMQRCAMDLFPLSKWVDDPELRFSQHPPQKQVGGANQKPDKHPLQNLIKMILFEVVHEDAISLVPEQIYKDIMFPSGGCYPYERASRDPRSPHSRKNYRFYEKGATTMATLYNKLRHQFFEESPDNVVVEKSARVSRELAKAALRLLQHLKMTDGVTLVGLQRLVAQQQFSEHAEHPLNGLPRDEVHELMSELVEGRGRVTGEAPKPPARTV